MGGTAASGPLAGVRVVDFSSFIAGCYCAQLLGEMGASVIKVESVAGDGARHWGPFLKGESRFFQGWNRNKRGIAIDLQSSRGQAIVHKLIETVDVAVENFRPGITAKLKIDYATLRRMNPRLIYCSMTAFGTKGPYGNRPGYDPILQSMSGASRGNVRYSGAVGICSVAVSDFGAAMLGCGAVAAALYHRERTGEGQLIETSLLQAVMSVQSHQYVKPLDVQEEPPFGIYPYRQYETKDDLIFIAAGTDRFWRLFCEHIGLAELGADPKYARNAGRVTHAEELTAKIQPILKTRTTAEWTALLVPAGVPCSGVHTYDEFFEDPQVAALGMDPTITHGKIGRMRVAGLPWFFEKTPAAIQRPAPLLGEHTREILGEMGYDEGEIGEMMREGIVSACTVDRRG